MGGHLHRPDYEGSLQRLLCQDVVGEQSATSRSHFYVVSSDCDDPITATHSYLVSRTTLDRVV